jgi:hypothetical protein
MVTHQAATIVLLANTKMEKVRRRANDVLLTHTCQTVARNRTQIALNVQTTAPLVQRMVTLRKQPVFASEQTFIRTVKELAFLVLSVQIALPRMDSYWLNLLLSLDIGDQALTVTSFHHVLLGTAR